MRYLMLVFVIILLLPLRGYSQYEKYLQKDPEPTDEAQAGVAFSVIENGTGVGGFYEIPLIGFTHLGATFNFFFLRDKKQIDYYDPYYNYPVTYGKVNNVYLLDLIFTLKKRLLPHEIDNNFRPFVSLGAGPVYGMNFPERNKFQDQYRWAFAAALAAGVDVAMQNNYLFGIRLQYRFMKFNAVLGEQRDHSTLDVRIELGKLL